MKPLQTALSLLTIAVVVVFPHLGLIPNFGYSIPILLFIWLVLKYNGDKFSDIGFRSKPLTLRAALIGSIAAVAILSTMQLLVFPVLEQFVEFESTDRIDIAEPSSINFEMQMSNNWTDGIDFQFPEGAEIIFDLKSPENASADFIFIGGEKWPVHQLPVRLSGNVE